MTRPLTHPSGPHFRAWICAAFALVALGPSSALAADEPGNIRRRRCFKVLSPNDKLATYGIDDPRSTVWPAISPCRKRGIQGLACLAERSFGLIAAGLPQIGPIISRGKMEQGDDMFRARRSLFSRKCRSCVARRQEQWMSLHGIFGTGSSKARRRIRPPRCHHAHGARPSPAVQKCGDFIQNRRVRQRLDGTGPGRITGPARIGIAIPTSAPAYAGPVRVRDRWSALCSTSPTLYGALRLALEYRPAGRKTRSPSVQ